MESIKKVDPANFQITKYKQIINTYLSKEEIKVLHQKNDLFGTWEVLYNWIWIIGSFVLVAFWTNVFTIVLALFIIGGKQLGCAIIMHDTSHYSLFKSRKTNIFIGNWFGAYPIIQNLEQYGPYHFQHHINTGTFDDPDLSLTKGYPTKLLSMIRKIGRDLIGATGIKSQLGLISMHLGYLKYNLAGDIFKIDKTKRPFSKILKNAFHYLKGPFMANFIIWFLLFICGHGWLYLLWIGALFTTFNFSLRIRSIAEHSVVEDESNPYKNTRTTYANFIEKILFAPLHVNYHLEHHFMIAAPSYNYPKLHKMLKERGFYEFGLLKSNYWEIFKMALIKSN